MTAAQIAELRDAPNDAVGRDRVAEVYASYRPLVGRVIARQVRASDRHLVDDLAQVTFLRAWPYLDTVRNPQALAGWLAAIARHVVSDHYRNRSHRPGARSVTEAPVAPDSPVWSTRASTAEPAEDAVAARVDVARALAELPPATRQAVQLRVVDGLPWKVIAARMHRGKPAVRRLTGEGLAALRGRLAVTDSPAASASAPAPWPGDRRMGGHSTEAQQRRWVASVARHVLADTPYQRRQPNPAAARRLRAAVEDLPADTRRVMQLRFAQSLPVGEVAAQLGRCRQTVHNHTVKGLTALGEALLDGPALAGSGSVTDAMVQARTAVASLREQQAAQRHQATEATRAEQLAHWHTEDQAAGVSAGEREGLALVAGEPA